MHVVNVEQAEAWNGPEGEHWAAHGAHAPSDIDGEVLDAAGVAGADRVLDIGCGTGQTTLAAARRARAGHALGLDLSGPQLVRARAQARAERLANVAFEQGDAQVHPLPDGGFDVAISRFGVMFFADPVAAFANVGRALAPGGRLAFVCPQAAADQPWFTEPLAALQDRLPAAEAADDDGPTGDGPTGDGPTGDGPAGDGPAETDADAGPGMFSLADPDRIAAVLTAAGFVDVRPAPLATPMDFGPTVDAAVAFYMGSGPLRAVLEAQPGLAEDARAALGATLGRYLTPAGVRVPATLWLVTARRP